MTNELENIEQIIPKMQKEFWFYENFIKNNKDIQTKSFESTYEHIFDIYSLRLQHIKEQGKSIQGLENLITNLKNVQNIDSIKTTILTVSTQKIVIFTDVNLKLFLGMIYLKND